MAVHSSPTTPRARHHLAVRQYHECVDTLERVLDVGPHPDTTRALDEVLEHA
jgi:hypothetical protein